MVDRPSYPAGVKSFSSRIIAWQRQHGRHDLPWQRNRDPYRIWLSEVMLQQTQVATVIPYFQRFIERFPDVQSLALADEDEVLAVWSGLGYYSRARHLHEAARIIAIDHSGTFPDSVEAIQRLPGIGRSTAAAIAVLAFGKIHAILDGNVKRVLARHGGIAGWPGNKDVQERLWALAGSRLPRTTIETYTQGMMDMGASLCTRTRPQCHACPVNTDCVAFREALIAELPTPRPKKILPEKSVHMLMLMDRGEILLEKRPRSGIWGGLWSLPEIPFSVDARHHCETALGFAVNDARTLPGLCHGFTHFRLRIYPHIFQIATRPPGTEMPGRLWLHPGDALEAALPAPVRALITNLQP